MSESIDWKTLTPAERNRLVAAKVMGWIEQPCDLDVHPGMELTIYSSGDACCPRCGAYDHINSFEHGIILPPPYSTSMDAALFVIERFTVGVELHYTPGRDYCCKIIGIIDEPSYGIARNPAEAVCIASLRTVGIEVRHG